jgi:hypothetical protein
MLLLGENGSGIGKTIFLEVKFEHFVWKTSDVYIDEKKEQAWEQSANQRLSPNDARAILRITNRVTSSRSSCISWGSRRVPCVISSTNIVQISTWHSSLFAPRKSVRVRDVEGVVSKMADRFV